MVGFIRLKFKKEEKKLVQFMLQFLTEKIRLMLSLYGIEEACKIIGSATFVASLYFFAARNIHIRVVLRYYQPYNTLSDFRPEALVILRLAG